MGNTVTASYVVDCYPLQSMSVITFYAVIINLSAFINPVSVAVESGLEIKLMGWWRLSSSLLPGKHSPASRGHSPRKESSRSLAACLWSGYCIVGGVL